MTNGRACAPIRRSIERHFRGVVGDELALRAHLPECSRCREYYNRRLTVEQLDPSALGLKRRLAVGLGLAPLPSQGLMRVWLPLAAAALLMLWVLPRLHVPPEFRARGRAVEPSSPELWIYRFSSSHAVEPVHGEIRQSDELAFAYRGSTEASYLLLFGRDPHGHVYWYYPEWTDATLDPASIPISTDPVRHELPAAISHKLDTTELELCGVFSRTAFHVREIERRLELTTVRELERLEGARLRCRTLRVAP